MSVLSKELYSVDTSCWLRMKCWQKLFFFFFTFVMVGILGLWFQIVKSRCVLDIGLRLFKNWLLKILLQTTYNINISFLISWNSALNISNFERLNCDWTIENVDILNVFTYLIKIYVFVSKTYLMYCIYTNTRKSCVRMFDCYVIYYLTSINAQSPRKILFRIISNISL